MLTAAAQVLRSDTSAVGWCRALDEAVKAVRHYGGAEPGDRTMVIIILVKLYQCAQFSYPLKNIFIH